MNQLSDEILLNKIFIHLTGRDLVNVKDVCPKFRRITEDHSLFQNYFPIVPKVGYFIPKYCTRKNFIEMLLWSKNIKERQTCLEKIGLPIDLEPDRYDSDYKFRGTVASKMMELGDAGLLPPLHLVIKYMDIFGRSMVEYFVNNTDINERDVYGNTALIWACGQSHKPFFLDIITLLVEKGADITIENLFGDNAFDISCTCLSNEHSVAVLQFLIEKGANINHQNHYGDTGFAIAASYLSVEIVELLMSHHVNPFFKNENCQSALDYAKSSRLSKLGEENSYNMSSEEFTSLNNFIKSLIKYKEDYS